MILDGNSYIDSLSNHWSTYAITHARFRPTSMKYLPVLVSLAAEVQNRIIYVKNVNNRSYMHIYGFNSLFMSLFSVILKCGYFYK